MALKYNRNMPIIDQLKQNLTNTLNMNELSTIFYGGYIFGSTLRDSQKPSNDSDIDFLIIGKDPITDKLAIKLHQIKKIADSINRCEIVYMRLSEIPLLISPALGQAWFDESYTVFGRDISILKSMVLDKISEREFYRNLIRRDFFNLYMSRQSIINSDEYETSNTTRTLAKSFIWAIRTKLTLDDRSEYKMTPAKIIDIYEPGNPTLSQILKDIVIDGKSITSHDSIWLLLTNLEILILENCENFQVKFNETVDTFNLRAV